MSMDLTEEQAETFYADIVREFVAGDSALTMSGIQGGKPQRLQDLLDAGYTVTLTRESVEIRKQDQKPVTIESADDT